MVKSYICDCCKQEIDADEIADTNAIKALFDSLVDSGFTEEQSMNLLNTILRVALSQGKE